MEIVVEPHIALISPDHDFPVEAVVAIERESGPSADLNAIGTLAAEKPVSDFERLIEDVMEQLQLRIVDQKEAHTRLVEDRADEFLVSADDARRRLHL